MNRFRTLLAATATLLLGAAVAHAQGLALPAYKPLPQKEKVKITWGAKIAVWAPVYLGKVTGDFEKENLEVEYIPARSSDGLVLLSTGKVDMMVGGLSASIFNSVAEGANIKIIAPSSLNPPESRQGVYVTKAFLAGRPYTPTMLKGQTIPTQVGLGSPITAYLARELAKVGGTLRDIQLRQMSGPDIVVALENGATNFAFLTDPFWLNLDKNKAQWLFMNEGDYSTGVYLVGPPLLGEKRAVAEAFVRVLARMHRKYLQGKYMSNPVVTAAMVKEMEVPLENLTRIPEHHFQPNLDLPPKMTSEMQEIFASTPNTLSYTKPLPYEKVIDNSFVAAALKGL